MTAEFADSALILVDIQNDFCPGGALAVLEGDRIVDVVNKLMPQFDLVISTQDWHPANHISFGAQGGPWPPHCVQGTTGAELHSSLRRDKIGHYFRKASTPDKDAYSEFEGVDEQGRSLDDVLKSHKVRKLYVAGLATDYCVKATVLDGLKLGYEIYAVTDGMRAVNVNPEDGARALAEINERGAHLVTSHQLIHDDESASIAR